MSERLDIYRKILQKVEELTCGEPNLLPVIDAAHNDSEFANLLEKAALLNQEYRPMSGILELYYLLLSLSREVAKA